MHLTDEKIIEMLIDYVTDSRYKQAVLIDGEWGSGKTYFIEEKLLEILNDTLSGRSVFYISLYGLDDFAQIMDEIYTVAFKDYFDKKLGDGKGEKLGKGLNLASKILSAGLKYFNIDSKELPSLSDIKQIKDAVIIFDDLERCNINVNQLFGFINNLVEHNNIKVILVANQAQIGKMEISRDLPQKYLVSLDSRILLDKVEGNKKDPKFTETKSINIDELISRTTKLFSEDILYKKIREKLIGLTIYYQADFNVIYESIIKKYVKYEKAKTQLDSNKQVVLDIFEKKQHYNIRTLIFGMMAYEKFFEILDAITFDPPKYLQEQKEQVLKYTMELSIQIKSGKPSYSWKNSTAETGMVYSGKWVFGESVYGYKFVDTYLMHRYLNSDEITKTIKSIMVEKKEAYDYHEAKNALVYNQLYYWWELEDEEILDYLSKIKGELTKQDYHPRYFKNIIVTLMQMKYNHLDGIVYEEYISLMKSKLENHNAPFEKQNLQILSDDKDFVQQYNSIAQPLFDVIDNKEKESKEILNHYLNDKESWGYNFAIKCKENKQAFLEDYKFLFYIDPDKVIEKLKVSSVKDIYSFLDGIKAVYNFSNLNDFFKADTFNIHSLLDKMDVEKLSQGKCTRKIVLKKLQSKLQESLELINK